MGKALFYIFNIRTVLCVLALQLRISRGSGQAAIELLKSTPVGRSRRAPADILRCVNFGLRIGAAFGLLESCLTRATIHCILLRRSGVDARAAFGLNKNGGILEGHCWVVCDSVETGYKDCSDQFTDVMYVP